MFNQLQAQNQPPPAQIPGGNVPGGGSLAQNLMGPQMMPQPMGGAMPGALGQYLMPR
jgi:hypothetical protein